MSLMASLRNMRAYWFGRLDGKALSKKHASLAYLSPPHFVEELARRYQRSMEALVYRYHRARGRLEAALERVQFQAGALEKVLANQEATPEVFTHMWGEWWRWVFLGVIFAAEMAYNKLAMDTLEVSQMEAYIFSFVATFVVFFMAHESGNQFRKGKTPFAILLVIVPVLMTLAFAQLRFDFTRRMAEINGDPPPSLWALVTLILLGIGLVAFTLYLGYKSPHEGELLLRRYHGLRLKERNLQKRLQMLQLRTQKHLDYLGSRYLEEVASYWRGFSRAWPRWDPAPGFVGGFSKLSPPAVV